MRIIQNLRLIGAKKICQLFVFFAFAIAAAAARPNILWLVAEDFGQHPGCYGTREVSSPHLDKLAREGAG